MDAVNNFLWVLPLLAQLSVLAVMLVDRSARQYPFLFSLVLTLFTVGLGGNLLYKALAPIPYSRFWVAGFVVGWSVTALALTEVGARSFEPYQRFAKLGHAIVQGVLAGSGILILGSLFIAPRAWTMRFYEFFQTQGYLVQGSLALLGFSVLAFAWLVGLKLRPDARLVVKVITVFCTGEAALGSGVSGAWPSASFYLGILWSTACWTTFAWLWARRPVEAHVGPRPPLDEEEAAAILNQMKARNSGLADMIRRG
jgi:hypothetical protein